MLAEFIADADPCGRSEKGYLTQGLVWTARKKWWSPAEIVALKSEGPGLLVWREIHCVRSSEPWRTVLVLRGPGAEMVNSEEEDSMASRAGSKEVEQSMLVNRKASCGVNGWAGLASMAESVTRVRAVISREADWSWSPGVNASRGKGEKP